MVCLHHILFEMHQDHIINRIFKLTLWVSPWKISSIRHVRNNFLPQEKIYSLSTVLEFSKFMCHTSLDTENHQTLPKHQQSWKPVILQTACLNVESTRQICEKENKLWSGSTSKGSCWRDKSANFNRQPVWIKRHFKTDDGHLTIINRQFHVMSQRSSLNNLLIQYSRSFIPPKHILWRSPCTNYGTGNLDTVEKQLLYLMDMWEMGDAVLLLRQSVMKGVIPNSTVVLNLQQQLANLGEVECLLELHEFLKEHKLTSDTKFFQCLQEAYYNSGRISEGVEVLRLLYHCTRKFSNVEVFFSLLTVMILRHFPDQKDSIISFVKDLRGAEVPVLEAEAALWKCYMLTEQWKEAENLLLSNEQLKKLIPAQISRICQGVDKVECDASVVLQHLLDLPFIKQKLRVLVAETLILELCNKKQWQHLLKLMNHMKALNIPIHPSNLTFAIKEMKLSQYDEQLQELETWCQGLQQVQEKE